MAMELSVFTPWYLLLTGKRAPTTSARIYLVFGGIFLVSYLLTTVIHALRLTSLIQKIVLFVLLIVSVWLGLTILVFARGSFIYGSALDLQSTGGSDISSFFRPELLVIAGIIIFWRRGASLAQEWIGPRAVMRAFRAGVVIFLLYGLVISLQSVDFPDLELFLFLFSGLLASGGARLSSLGRLRGGKPLPMNRRWLLGIIVLSGILISVTVSIGVLTRVTLLELVSDALRVIIDTSARLFMLLARPVALLIIRIVEWFLMRLSLLLSEAGQNIEQFEEVGEDIQDLMADLDQQVEPPAWAADVGEWISTILVSGVVFLVAVILINGLVRRARSRSWDLDEERDALLDPKDLPQLILNNLRQRAAQALAALSRLRPGERLRAAARIRRIYAELLDLSAKLGSPRPVASTPNEFVIVLQGLFSPLHDELNTITHAYLRVRYGELPETRQEVQDVEAAWDRIRARGEEMLFDLHQTAPKPQVQV
jgi:hypothetical protein